MSLYNMVQGFNPACVLFLPMLGRKAEDYPRFRDCFIDADKHTIEVYTRVGSANQNCGFGEEELYEDPNYLGFKDDSFDNTYGCYSFSVPEEFKEDFDYIMNDEFEKVSDKYFKVVCEFYPTLAKRGELDDIFRRRRN